MAELMLGGNGFKGLIPLMRELMEVKDFSAHQKLFVERYFTLLEGRVTGKTLTGAAYFRKIVTTHPEYKKDSIVSDEISYDLLRAAALLGNNCMWDKELLGEPWWK